MSRGIILDYADKHHMKVFVGLGSESDWWKRWSDAAFLEEIAGKDAALANDLWKRYGQHRSFAGWYLAEELWDGPYTNEQIDRLRSFLRKVSDHCRQLSGSKVKPVAIAPFFNGKVEPQKVEKIYARLLADSGIDIVMLQDGIGARGWDDEVTGQIVPYFRAFRNACLAAGVELWSDLESFARIPDPANPSSMQFVPTSADRIGRQLTAAAPFVQRFVTFDFFHYMSPHRNEASKKLNEQYMETFVEHRFLPAFGRSAIIDPTFAYYLDRSPESVAAELSANGYNIVHYILTADSNLNPTLIEALHRQNIGIWYQTFGNGAYTDKDLPQGWEAWKMVRRADLEGKPVQDGFIRLCLNHPDYRAWCKRRIGMMLRKYPFQGVEIAEPHWPAYPGPKSDQYGMPLS